MRRYPSDLTEKQWRLVESHYKHQYNRQGRPPSKQLRDIWNAILYVTRTGCSWRMLPKDFPNWSAVYHHFRQLKKRGKLDKIMKSLHELVREQSGKESTPSVGIVDSQSIKTRSPKKRS